MTNERDWMMDALRDTWADRDMSDLSPFERRFTERLMSALDAPVSKSDVTLKDDALEVLGDARDEVLAEMIEKLDRLVSRAKSGGVILSEGETDADPSPWDQILRDQLAEKIRQAQNKSNADPDVYRQLFGAKSETRQKQDVSEYSERFANRG